MANLNPFQARLSRRRKVGDLDGARRKLWQAIQQAESVLLREDIPLDLKLRAVHAVSQSVGQFAKLIEVGELEARVMALEEAAQQRRTA